jgi:hypothetical protein
MRTTFTSRTAKVLAALTLAVAAAVTVTISSAPAQLPANYLADYSTSPA